MAARSWRRLWRALTLRPRLAAQIDAAAREHSAGARVSNRVADSTYGQMGMLPLSRRLENTRRRAPGMWSWQDDHPHLRPALPPQGFDSEGHLGSR